MHFNGYFTKTSFLMLFQFTKGRRRKHCALVKASAFTEGAGTLLPNKSYLL